MITEHLVARNTITARSRHVTDQLHRELCATSSEQVQHPQLAGLLVHLGARLSGSCLTVELPAARRATAEWIADTLGQRHVAITDHRTYSAVAITRPAATLAPYGYRVGPDGAYWCTPTTGAASVGIARGAAQASGLCTTTTGLYIATPDHSAAAALLAHLAHVGITYAHHHRSRPLVSITGHHAPAALTALGLTATSAAQLDWLKASRQLQLVSANTHRARTAARTHIATACTLAVDELPAELAEAVQLRLDNPDLSLAELAARTSPPITKDAYAGRLRRALARRAAPLPAAS